MALESVEVFFQYYAVHDNIAKSDCKPFSYAFPAPQYQSRRYNIYSNILSTCANLKPNLAY